MGNVNETAMNSSTRAIQTSENMEDVDQASEPSNKRRRSKGYLEPPVTVKPRSPCAPDCASRRNKLQLSQLGVGSPGSSRPPSRDRYREDDTSGVRVASSLGDEIKGNTSVESGDSLFPISKSTLPDDFDIPTDMNFAVPDDTTESFVSPSPADLQVVNQVSFAEIPSLTTAIAQIELDRFDPGSSSSTPAIIRPAAWRKSSLSITPHTVFAPDLSQSPDSSISIPVIAVNQPLCKGNDMPTAGLTQTADADGLGLSCPGDLDGHLSPSFIQPDETCDTPICDDSTGSNTAAGVHSASENVENVGFLSADVLKAELRPTQASPVAQDVNLLLEKALSPILEAPKEIPPVTTYADATNLAVQFPELASHVLTRPLYGSLRRTQEGNSNSSQKIGDLRTQVLKIPHTAERPNWAAAPDEKGAPMGQTTPVKEIAIAKGNVIIEEELDSAPPAKRSRRAQEDCDQSLGVERRRPRRGRNSRNSDRPDRPRKNESLSAQPKAQYVARSRNSHDHNTRLNVAARPFVSRLSCSSAWPATSNGMNTSQSHPDPCRYESVPSHPPTSNAGIFEIEPNHHYQVEMLQHMAREASPIVPCVSKKSTQTMPHQVHSGSSSIPILETPQAPPPQGFRSIHSSTPPYKAPQAIPSHEYQSPEPVRLSAQELPIQVIHNQTQTWSVCPDEQVQGYRGSSAPTSAVATTVHTQINATTPTPQYGAQTSTQTLLPPQQLPRRQRASSVVSSTGHGLDASEMHKVRKQQVAGISIAAKKHLGGSREPKSASIKNSRSISTKFGASAENLDPDTEEPLSSQGKSQTEDPGPIDAAMESFKLVESQGSPAVTRTFGSGDSPLRAIHLRTNSPASQRSPIAFKDTPVDPYNISISLTQHSPHNDKPVAPQEHDPSTQVTEALKNMSFGVGFGDADDCWLPALPGEPPKEHAFSHLETIDYATPSNVLFGEKRRSVSLNVPGSPINWRRAELSTVPTLFGLNPDDKTPPVWMAPPPAFQTPDPTSGKYIVKARLSAEGAQLYPGLPSVRERKSYSKAVIDGREPPFGNKNNDPKKAINELIRTIPSRSVSLTPSTKRPRS